MFLRGQPADQSLQFPIVDMQPANLHATAAPKDQFLHPVLHPQAPPTVTPANPMRPALQTRLHLPPAAQLGPRQDPSRHSLNMRLLGLSQPGKPRIMDPNKEHLQRRGPHHGHPEPQRHLLPAVQRVHGAVCEQCHCVRVSHLRLHTEELFY